MILRANYVRIYSNEIQMAFPLKKICDKTKSEYLYQAKCVYVVYLTYAPLLCLDTVEYRRRIIIVIEPENVAVISRSNKYIKMYGI